VKPLDLIASADILLKSCKGKPSQVSLRRATSSAYYAMFHCLARNCADSLVGGTNSGRSKHAWRQTYRALEHGFAKSACKDGLTSRFPKAIEDFANNFVIMQEKRHLADYDPSIRLTKSEVAADIRAATEAISGFQKEAMPKRGYERSARVCCACPVQETASLKAFALMS
jgi:uncharacterized protein (UPF0332 family)